VRVALLPITVHAQGTETDYLSTGLAQMLAARLEQYQGMVVVRPGGASAPPAGQREALEAAQASDADFVLFGSFTRFGDGASLDLRCARVVEATEGNDEELTVHSRRVFIHSGELAQIIPKLEVLAEKVARYIFAEQGDTARVVGTAPAQNDAGSGLAVDVEDLMRRVDALERSVFTPVATGERPATDEAVEEGEATIVR
jgi:TolB-like protein